MKHFSSRLLLISVAIVVTTAVACQTGAPKIDEVARVVMISYDGLGADLAWQWIEDGVVTEAHGLAGLAAEGRSARRLHMESPTLTAVNHTTLVTGRPPEEHGIVSNSFHRVGSAFPHTSSGYSAPIAADPLWVTARRQGKRTGVLLWPGADARGIDRMGDFGVVWPNRALMRSDLIELDPAAAGPQPELAPNDGLEALSWILPLPGNGSHASRLEIVAADGVADGTARYDLVAVRLEGDPSWTFLGEREWFPVSVEATGRDDLRAQLYGAWSKILRLDRFTGALRLYRGGFWRTIAYPVEFQDDLDEHLGPWPGPPDDEAISDWWLDMSEGIDLDTYLEQVERFDRYLDRLALRVLDQETFDLLLAYHPAVDEYLHSSHIVESGQWAYSPGAAIASREGLKRVAQSVDLSIATMWRALEPAHDLLVVVSDHGLIPTTDVVALNRALADAGLVETETVAGRQRVAASSPLMAVSSGACSHLYLNLRGRDKNGVVAYADSAQLLRDAAKVLADITIDDRPVVERILTRSEARAEGLGHRDCGDLVIFMTPGFSARTSVNAGIVEPSKVYAQHGYLAHHAEMDGVFFARGAGLARKRLREMKATEVAPAVAFWMGLRWPE